MFNVLLVFFVIIVILLIPTILLQSGSGAQSGMFGSDLAMGAFGAKTSEVMVRFTKWLVALFFILAFLLGYIKIQESKAYLRKIQQQQDVNQVTQTTNAQATSAPANTINTNIPGTIPVLPKP